MKSVLLLAAVVITASCSDSGGDDDASSTTTTPESLKAVVASYDLAVGDPQRFLVGLVAEEGKLVSFGSVDLSFSYLGTKSSPLASAERGPEAEAKWFPVAGQELDEPPTVPTVVAPSKGTGVYEAEAVTFDKAGVWQVDVEVDVGTGEKATTQFEVLPENRVIAPGDEAPRVENHLPGTSAAPPKAVDSRAEDDGSVPDPELHSMTVADAIGNGRPTMVVVSTPVYCQSQFCGPITDAVQRLAQRFGDRMNFIHLEVWRDFERQAINKAAADWMYRDGGDNANEPWVFVVDRDGVVRHRLDNVISDAQLDEAVTHELNAEG